MVTNWPTKKLGDVAKIEGGGTPSTTNPLFWNGDVPWLTPKELSDFSDSEIFDTERKITNEGLNRSSTKLFPAGTVLFTSRAPIGYVVIAGIEMATNQGFKNFICDEKILSNKFLYYFLKFKTKYLQSLGRGATFTEISRSILAKVDIPIPPIVTQKQIVERLDKIAEAQKLNDGLIQKTDELFQSLLHKELNPAGKDWEVKDLEDIAKIIMGQSPSSTSYNESSDGLPFFQGKADFGELYPNTMKYCSAPSRIAEPEDILISVRAPVGDINLAKSKSCIGRGLAAIQGNNKIAEQMFLYFFFRKNEKNWQKQSTGSTFAAITKDKLTDYKIPVPPLEIQKQIVAKLSAIQDYKIQLLAQKSKLKELFDSALTKSFNYK